MPRRTISFFPSPSNRRHRRHQKMPCFDHGAAFRHNRKKPLLQCKKPAQNGQDERVVNGTPAAADLPLLRSAPPAMAGPHPGPRPPRPRPNTHPCPPCPLASGTAGSSRKSCTFVTSDATGGAPRGACIAQPPALDTRGARNQGPTTSANLPVRPAGRRSADRRE
jgi:hypothetical protein